MKDEIGIVELFCLSFILFLWIVQESLFIYLFYLIDLIRFEQSFLISFFPDMIFFYLCNRTHFLMNINIKYILIIYESIFLRL